MIDLTNKYVPNVDNELRAEFIKEAEKQGIEAYSSKTLYSGFIYLTVQVDKGFYEGISSLYGLELFQPEPKADWQNKPLIYMYKEEVLQFVQDFYDDNKQLQFKYTNNPECAWDDLVHNNIFRVNTERDVIYRIKPTKSKDQLEREEKIAKLEAKIKEAMGQVEELKKGG